MTTGAVGVIRHDPMAMLPFCGYNIGEYFEHWLDIGEKLGDKAPQIFSVNWFRTDENKNFVWPGFGENFRVIEWILARCDEKISAKETPIGYVPNVDDISLKGLNIDKESLEKLLEVVIDLWKNEVSEIKEFYKKFGNDLPKKLVKELCKLEENLSEEW